MSEDHDASSSSPPTRASLKAWWKQFNKRTGKPKKDEKDSSTGVVFGVPLKDSLRYASVQISTANGDGELYVWGYIPVVVAKCGLYLKERATETEGVFRVSGSTKRMRELQAIFEAPPRYGKSLDWKKETYTTHDVASVFRRYLTMMPEPVIPTNLYHEFRDVYRRMSKADDIIQEYKRLIRSMSRSNQYLLLYVLDLLSVFARKSDKNLMTASNLAVIFRPGILAHPDHDMVPSENDLSQRVVEFLIDHQDWFMLDVPPPPRSNSTMSSNPIYPSQSPSSIRTDDDLVIVPSSDEERNNARVSNSPNGAPGALGGWRLIPRRKRTRDQKDPNSKESGKESGDSKEGNTTASPSRAPDMTRSKSSKSSVERRGTIGVSETGELTAEEGGGGSGGEVVLGKAVTVTRSRTFPSKGSTSDKEKSERSSNVLRKTRRNRPTSTQVPSGKENVGGGHSRAGSSTSVQLPPPGPVL